MGSKKRFFKLFFKIAEITVGLCAYWSVALVNGKCYRRKGEWLK